MGSGRLRLSVLENASQATLTPWVNPIVAPGAIVHPTAGTATASSPTPATSTGHGCNGARSPTNRSCCHAPTAPPPTSRRGCRAPTTGSHPSTSRSNSMSASSATTVVARRWRPSSRCLDSARPPTARSRAGPPSASRSRPDSHEPRNKKLASWPRSMPGGQCRGQVSSRECSTANPRHCQRRSSRCGRCTTYRAWGLPT